MGKLRYILILLVVLAIAFFTRWLLTSIEEPTTRARDKLRHDPDYFVSNFKTVVYDKDGNPAYHFEAQHLEHFPDNDTMEITKLNAKFVSKDNQVWLASADQGILYENSNVLQLTQNVILKKETKIAAEKLELRTEELRFDFANKLATSSVKVNLLGENSTISAVGIKIDMKTGILTLQSEAAGHYEPR